MPQQLAAVADVERAVVGLDAVAGRLLGMCLGHINPSRARENIKRFVWCPLCFLWLFPLSFLSHTSDRGHYLTGH